VSVVQRLDIAAVSVAEATTIKTARADAWRSRYRSVAVASDAVCALAFGSAVGHYAIGSAPLAALATTLTFVGAVGLAGGYGLRHAAATSYEYRAIGTGFVAMMAIAMAVAFLHVADLPPAPVLLGAAGIAASSALLRTAQRNVLATKRAGGAFRSRAIVVAASQEPAARIVRNLAEAHPGLDFVGACVQDAEAGAVLDNGVEVLAATPDAAVLSEVADLDLVLVAAGSMNPDALRRLQWAAERVEAEIAVVPDVSDVLSSRVDLQVLGTTPMMSLLQPSTTQRVGKLVMDRTLGTLLALLFSPVILVGMALVRLTSPGPAIFRQVRIGRDGQPFTMLKLRTMCIDAEQRREDLVEASTGAGPLFKMRSDPRVTPVGRVLRRFSIDELPQLWNVVRGDMSLVGPRPPLPSEVAAYDSMAVHRLHVKPGLTGLWQVSGRSDLNWEQSVRLDLLYVDNWSIFEDLKILWRTARAVLGSRGAY
jgi:exopolysaccharide biosynthesis polyprenyl glycosylphosphotransferase